jgi:BirA family biotin operon repressor/biotin-[acetyl-CoA-carboxylase] ligase
VSGPGRRSRSTSLEAVAAEDTLNIDRIRQQLDAATVGRRIVLHEVVASTNETLRQLAEAGAPEGTVVLAERQTAGLGRGNRPWFSPPNVNLYASILFRPAIGAAGAPAFAFIASLALADAVRELGIRPAVKWPNDVLVSGHKVAGVRAEMWSQGDAVDGVILGVGVNLNVTHEALRAGLGKAGHFATSLREALGQTIDRNAFTASFLIALEEWLAIYRAQGAPAVLAAWRDLDVVTGRRVEVRDGRTRFDGRAVGVNAAGHLQVEDDHGRVRTVVAGEIRLLE